MTRRSVEIRRWSIWAVHRRIRGWLGSATWRVARFRTAHGLLTLLARAMAQADAWLARLGTLSAAFLAVSGERPLRS